VTRTRAGIPNIRGFIPDRHKRFRISEPFRPAVGPTHVLILTKKGLFPGGGGGAGGRGQGGGIIRPRTEVNHSFASCAEMKNECSYNLTVPHMPARQVEREFLSLRYRKIGCE
jgi:hypothetical protein